MLGIPGGAVLIKALFFLRASIFGAFPCRSQQGEVRFGRDGIGEGYLLAAHALAEGNCPRFQVGLGVQMHIQPSGSLPKIKEDDRFLAPHHTVEPDRGLDLAVHTQLFKEWFGMWRVSRQRRAFLEHQVRKIDRAGAVRNGRLHGNAHDTHILFPVDNLRQPDKSNLSHPASTSSRRDGLPIPSPRTPPAGGCP